MGKSFALRFKDLRTKMGWTQEQLAERLGVVAKYVGMIENEKKDVDPDGPLAKLFDVIEGAALDQSPRAKLKRLVENAGLTPAKLAKKIEYDAGVVENVINGAGRISEKMAEKIVAILDHGLTVDELLAGSETPRVIEETGFRGTVGAKPTKGKRYIPRISWAAAGVLSKEAALDEDFDGEGVETDVPGRAFAVEISGDSMYPEISPGDLAVVRSDIPPRPGKVVLVRTIHGDVLCKRYSTRDRDQLVILSSVNKSYEPIEIPAAEIAWIYPVKQVIRNY